jgi:hypothetical protein
VRLSGCRHATGRRRRQLPDTGSACRQRGFAENRSRLPPLGATRATILARAYCVKETPAFQPALPAVERLLLRGEPTDSGMSEFFRAPKSVASIVPGSTVTDPEELVTSALAILGGHKIAPSPALDQQLPPLRADTMPTGILRQNGQPNAAPVQQRTLSDGSLCALPIRYFDAQLLIATFLVGRDRASALLKNTGLTAVPQADGKAIVSFGCFQYRKTDIGPYNEVGLVVLATAPKSPIPALYVVHLPVNTALANRAGREIWGYNKFVASIDITDSPQAFSMTIRDPDGATIARFSGTRSASISMPPNDMITFSLLDGQLIRAIIQVMTPSQIGGGGGFSLKIGESMHPMADSLRTLALDNASPVLVQHADPFLSLLFPGQLA